jgi:hypothetical protein
MIETMDLVPLAHTAQAMGNTAAVRVALDARPVVGPRLQRDMKKVLPK